jgi:hypothetical protein
MNYPVADYQGGCGENSSAGLVNSVNIPYTVAINGNVDLSGCVIANDNGKVFGITVTGSPGIYDYVVNVDAQGPEGIGSGYMYLAFTDETDDTYELKIYSSYRSVHTVRYNSQSPIIKQIQWSNAPIAEREARKQRTAQKV